MKSSKFNQLDFNDDLQWFRADEIKVGDYLYFPKVNNDGVEKPIKLDCSEEIGDSNFSHYNLENGTLIKVFDISVVKNDIGKVYDIEVEDNHNYLTDSFLVHNSAVGSLVCYCLGITDVDPIKHDLLFSRFLSPSRGGRSMKLRFSGTPISSED